MVVQSLAQPLVNGILLGGLYALIGIGMSMVFGIMKLTNLAHGDLLILSSYLSFGITQSLGLNPLLTVILVTPVMFFVGYAFQNLLLNRMLGKGAESPMLVTFGISIILQNSLLAIFSPDARALTSNLASQSVIITNYLSIPVIYLVDFFAACFVILILNFFLKKTYPGRAIRAASDDGNVAKLMGINIKRIYSIAMGIAMMTAAIAGVLVGMTYNFYPYTGTQYLIIAFGVVVIGGMGSIGGTLVAGVILGLAQVLGAHFFGTEMQLLSGYIVLLAMLVLRPQGLFGHN
ncbi:branched-chain amino acid ABC transporter permease [Desulfosporosinus fructosivorans]|uniref:Branched-chain amino acid ABC transporter permease n=1 Tax=Desulfosporosinus fructosivorans TaxID=2018669 RepID=A0A4Z0R6A4_9FIRM|nr:branched-chain amino acid ABC transporter permease [Desulfosporosinus fructosivorans]TGE38368.1 branched-chain amino acid ABC transporter permease [Desulfosporosinus fructosivorans]